MNRLFARSRRLLLVVAVVLLSTMGTVSASRAASLPAAGGGLGGAAHGARTTAAAGSPAAQCIFGPAATCSSTNPTVGVRINYYGDSADCIFSWDVYWGDGHSTDNIPVVGPANGYRLLTTHTFATAGTYFIAISGQVLHGNCVANPGVEKFTLLTCPAQNNHLWYGYVTCGEVFTSVSATWTVPTAHGGGNKKASFWVGLGGIGGTSLEQDGTESNVKNGKAVYTAWWEIVPQKAHFLKSSSYPVAAGDVMSASVTANGDDYVFKMVDKGRRGAHHKWTFTSPPIPFTGGGLNSAEAIVEDTGTGALTNFGSVTFSQISVNHNALATYGPQQIVAPENKVSLSGVSGGNQFKATFVHS